MFPASRKLLPIFCIWFLENFGFALVFSIFAPLLLTPTLHFLPQTTDPHQRNLLLGILLASFPLSQFFGTPFLGDIADRFGRKKAFYITITGSAIGFFLSGWAVHIANYTFLLFSRFFSGFFAGNLSICLASIADISPDERSKQKNYALIALIGGISWITAVLLGGYFSDPQLFRLVNPAIPFWITALLFLLSLLALWLFFEETQPSTEPFRIDLLKGARNIIQTLEIKGLRFLYVIYFFWIFGWGLAFQWMAPFSLERYQISEQNEMWGLLILGIFWLIGSYPVNNWLIQRYESRTIVKIGYFPTMLLLLVAGLSPIYPLFAGSVSLAGVFAAFSWSNILNLLSQVAPPQIQGKIMGISQSSMALGFILATILGGIIGAFALSWMYLIAAMAFFLGFLLLMRAA